MPSSAPSARYDPALSSRRVSSWIGSAICEHYHALPPLTTVARSGRLISHQQRNGAAKVKPGNTPELTDTQTIHALAEYEERGAPVVTTRHRDLPLRVQLDPAIKVIELTAALAYSGFTLVNNPEVGGLYLTYARGAK